MLKICLVVDVEGFVSLKQINPMWNSWQRVKARINYLLRNVRYTDKAYYKMHDLVEKYKFPISFMLTSQFKPLKKEKFIDYGYHTLNHRPLIYLSNQEIEKETRNIYNSKSFSAPLWMTEEISSPDKVFKILKEEGYKILIYRGRMNKIIPVKGDKISGIEKPFILHGMKCVYPSFIFTGKEEEIKNIRGDILKNSKKDAVYLITTHDFVFKDLRNFIYLLRLLKSFEKEKLIKIVNLGKLA